MSSLIALLRRLPAALLLVAVLALITFTVLGVRSWLHSHDAAVQLATTIATQKRVIDQATAQEQQRDSELAKTLASITQKKQQVQTPAEAVAQIPQALPPLPDPVALTMTPPTAANPAPAAVADVPQADLKPLYDYVQDCRACQAKLAAAQGNLTDEQSKVTALTAERDAAVKAAKGQGFWKRVKHDAKWFAIGAAVAALAIEANRH